MVEVDTERRKGAFVDGANAGLQILFTSGVILQLIPEKRVVSTSRLILFTAVYRVPEYVIPRPAMSISYLDPPGTEEVATCVCVKSGTTDVLHRD